jgi:hypothetical protein
MSDDTSRRKAPQAPSRREVALQAIADYRKELAEKYEADLKNWKARRHAEIERVRTKLNRPGWAPNTRLALDKIGEPPVNPLAAPFWQFRLP